MVCPHNYCQNGGNCETTATTFYCQCADGYEGDQCDQTSGLSGGAIGGIAVGSIVGLLTIAAALTCLMMIQKGIFAPKSPISPVNPGFPPINYGNMPQFMNPGDGNAILMDGRSLHYPYQPDVNY
ncbi:uncharacterized protein [Amphiura filiformis]|uniref:uncharacterized protein n=1 Tax=Amphiura filiformis TaxID=82378 RepID=UPI003B20BEE6